MRRSYVVLLMLAFSCVAAAQSRKSPGSNAVVQRPGFTSKTYRDTLRMLKAWDDTPEGDDLARLFTAGRARVSDLVAACSSGDKEIAGAAFLALQLLGTSTCRSCPDLVLEDHAVLSFSCATRLSNADFGRIEQWLAKNRSATGFDCGGEDGPTIDESLIYALILDGSPRSESVLSNMQALERACEQTETINGEALENAQSLIGEAKEVGHNLKLEPAIDKAIRAAAFFLPVEYRKDSNVEVLARTHDRILLSVSYHCGSLCGRGYYVVLRRDGPVWQYAVVRMAWIS